VRACEVSPSVPHIPILSSQSPMGLLSRQTSKSSYYLKASRDLPASNFRRIRTRQAHDVVDTILSAHYHRGSDDTLTSRLDTYLTSLADRELGIEEGLREALHTAVNRSGPLSAH
jgi:hypothetical protein